MKYKTTRKAIINGTAPALLYRAGYCDLQDLLNEFAPSAYTCGVYGWNFDVYDVDGVTITTGYRGTVGKELPAWVYEANKAARGMDWKERKEYAHRVFERLFDESVKGV